MRGIVAFGVGSVKGAPFTRKMSRRLSLYRHRSTASPATLRYGVGSGMVSRRSRTPRRQAQQRALIVAVRRLAVLGDDLRHPLQGGQQADQWPRHRQDHSRAEGGYSFRVPAELDRVAEPLLAMEQYRLAVQGFPAQPQRPDMIRVRPLVGSRPGLLGSARSGPLVAPLIVDPPAFQVSEQQFQACLVEVGVRKIGFDGHGPFVALLRLVPLVERGEHSPRFKLALNEADNTRVRYEYLLDIELNEYLKTLQLKVFTTDAKDRTLKNPNWRNAFRWNRRNESPSFKKYTPRIRTSGRARNWPQCPISKYSSIFVCEQTARRNSDPANEVAPVIVFELVSDRRSLAGPPPVHTPTVQNIGKESAFCVQVHPITAGQFVVAFDPVSMLTAGSKATLRFSIAEDGKRTGSPGR